LEFFQKVKELKNDQNTLIIVLSNISESVYSYAQDDHKGINDRYRAIRSFILLSGVVVLPFRILHRNEAKIRGYSGCSPGSRTLERPGLELGYLMRRETVRKGPEAEEQTRIRMPKRRPAFD